MSHDHLHCMLLVFQPTTWLQKKVSSSIVTRLPKSGTRSQISVQISPPRQKPTLLCDCFSLAEGVSHVKRPLYLSAARTWLYLRQTRAPCTFWWQYLYFQRNCWNEVESICTASYWFSCPSPPPSCNKMYEAMVKSWCTQTNHRSIGLFGVALHYCLMVIPKTLHLVRQDTWANLT